MSQQAINLSSGITHKGLTISLFVLRIALGGLMFEAGLDKLLSGYFQRCRLYKAWDGTFY